MFAVVVSFTIKPEYLEAFLPLMLENARRSLEDEPDCHQFDVATDTARPGDVFLYELYTDKSAFDSHLASQHFKSFDAASASMIASKSVTTYDEVRQ